MGTPSSNSVDPIKDTGSTLTCFSSAAVCGLSPAQNRMFSGVVMVASRLEMPVIDTDSAVLPRAMWVMRLEILPPGQAATTIMPNAMDGCGFNSMVIAQVTVGRNSSCETRPAIG